MPEHDPHVLSYVHLAQFNRADDALRTLKKVASVVKPIMRAHNWRVKQLAEFYPSNANLLGLNVNRGAKICVRLRYPGDKDQFLPLDQVVDTMLHELCHIVHGPHNAAFHALWEKLRDEHTELIIKGFTGENFLSDGRRLGGGSAGHQSGEVRRLSRLAVEKRQNLTSRGQRLRGKSVLKQDLRKAAADAAERRNRSLKGCPAEELSESQISNMADVAISEGFWTKAEENEANDIAIARALSELINIEEEKHNVTTAKVPTESRLISIGEASRRDDAAVGGPGPLRPPPNVIRADAASGTVGAATAWVCAICTLYNPPNYLCCDACGIERPNSQQQAQQQQQQQQQQPITKRQEFIDLT